jgi:hypothetical protein
VSTFSDISNEYEQVARSEVRKGNLAVTNNIYLLAVVLFSPKTRSKERERFLASSRAIFLVLSAFLLFI